MNIDTRKMLAEYLSQLASAKARQIQLSQEQGELSERIDHLQRSITQVQRPSAEGAKVALEPIVGPDGD